MVYEGQDITLLPSSVCPVTLRKVGRAGGIYDLYRNGTLPEGYAFIQSLYNATKIRTPQSRQSSSEYLCAPKHACISIS